MSDRTGLGAIETALLESFARCDALPGNDYVKSSHILRTLDLEHGIGPLLGYRVLCDLARPYVSHLRLVDFHGNYGSPDFSEASAKYTESRLTPLGVEALQAERRERSPLPIGLINGNTHVDGLRPPFAPDRMVRALHIANEGGADDEIVDAIGQPEFPTGSVVSIGDPQKFRSGRPARLRVEARIEYSVDRSGQPLLVISDLPPRSGADDVGGVIQRAAGLPILDVNDVSQGGTTRLEVWLSSDADAKFVATQLSDLWGVHRMVPVELGESLAAIVRSWVERCGDAEMHRQLAPIGHHGS